MFSSVLAAIAALPQIISALGSLWAYLQKVSGNDPAGLLLKVSQTFDQLNNAKTETDRAAATKGLADLIAGMPSK